MVRGVFGVQRGSGINWILLAGSSLTACLNQTVSSKKSIPNSCARKRNGKKNTKVIPFFKQQCLSSSVKTMKFVLLASRATENIVRVLKKNSFVLVQLFGNSLYWRESGSSWDSILSIKLHTFAFYMNSGIIAGLNSKDDPGRV